ncbi:ROK family protein [Saccharicrinis aurantiacus]|uniref:ROK family protein n=1 Tax=Saccharicrinis aurantiacus TaxID=1849719 RepID=UPI0024926913|nr:ROK family protein [Saccharicrinis aurantiacus]
MDTVLGIDIGGTSITCGIVEGKELKNIYNKPTYSHLDAEGVFSNLLTCIDEVLSDQVIAIGLGVPGLIDEEEGRILNINNIPSWKNFPLKQRLQDHYKLPVFINNDANCFAIGTKHFGKGQDYKSFIGIVLGTGVGGGVIVNDKLHSGVLCSAGEVGCMPYLDGVFEDYCGSTFFPKKSNLTGQRLAQLAEIGDEKALKVFREYGQHMGKLISNLIFTLSPNAFILGGSITQSFHLFEPGIKSVIEDFPFKSVSEKIEIVPDHFDNIAILGAAGLYYNSL